MNNNDILRRLRFIFSFNDATLLKHFKEGGLEVIREEMLHWLKKEEHEEFVPLYDVHLAAFLNGWIAAMRGKKEGEEVKPEKSLNNNAIFRKIRIALNLKDDEILEILNLANFRFSKSELAALFRKPDHEKFRVCKDQVLRNFLTGLQMKHHPVEEGREEEGRERRREGR